MISSKLCRYGRSSFIILAALFSCTTGATVFHAMEGDLTQLNFSFPCVSAQVTLRYGIRAPFYDSAFPSALSLPENQELVVHNDTESDNCLIRLQFVHVLKSDDGGYILTYYNSEQIYQGDTRIVFRVDYPPGKASCEWNEKNILGDWRALLCRASTGSSTGNFVCYQNGLILPPKDSRRQVGNVLQQNIWGRYSQTAFCCSVLQEIPIDICACKDFVWDPLHSGIITDPCRDLRELTTPQSSEEYTTICITTNQTTGNTSGEEKAHQLLSWVSWVHWLVSAALVLLIIVQCVVVQLKSRTIRKLKTIHSDEKGVNDGGPPQELGQDQEGP